MITSDMVHDAIARVVLHRLEGTNSIVCGLVLRNGHVVVGEYHCSLGTEFDAAIGTVCARQDAERKVAELLAYEQRCLNG